MYEIEKLTVKKRMNLNESNVNFTYFTARRVISATFVTWTLFASWVCNGIIRIVAFIAWIICMPFFVVYHRFCSSNTVNLLKNIVFLVVTRFTINWRMIKIWLISYKPWCSLYTPRIQKWEVIASALFILQKKKQLRKFFMQMLNKT